MKPNTRFWIGFVVLFGAVLALGYSIWRNDAPLRESSCTKSSAALEWVVSPVAAKQIVTSWIAEGMRGTVTKGLLIDFGFIVAYVLCLVVVLRRCAVVIKSIDWWPAAARSFIRAAVIAGLLDVVENAGILLELYARAYWLAPVVACVAIVKWVIVIVTIVFILSSAILAWREWAARDVDSKRELESLDTSSASPQSP